MSLPSLSGAKSTRICLIEDDPTISRFVGEKLTRSGYGVDTFAAAEPVLASPSRWDLFIVDVLLEGELSGLDLCRELRERRHDTPILVLSALGEPSDRIEGLRTGADDYLTKPFEMDELLLRVSAMLRRRSWYGALPENSETYRWADNWINFRSFEAGNSRRTFQLSQKECMLMKLLIEKRNEVVSRSDILDKVWGYDVFPSSRTVDNFIVRLRKYFETTPSHPRFIHSIRGAGYKFTPEDQ